MSGLVMNQPDLDTTSYIELELVEFMKWGCVFELCAFIIQGKAKIP